MFSQNMRNLVDIWPPSFPSVFMVKIHSASMEKGKSEKEGSNECCMKELCPYVSLIAPGKLQCALLLVPAVCWVSAE